MYLGFILWAIVLVVILWNISPALVITSALIGIVPVSYTHLTLPTNSLV